MQCELSGVRLNEEEAMRMAGFSHNPNSVAWALDIAALRRRERELLEKHGQEWIDAMFPVK